MLDTFRNEFPHFKVVKFIRNLGGSKGSKCLCERGKTFVASSTQIRAACIVSCGCIEPEKELNHKAHKNHIGYYIDGSCYTNIGRKPYFSYDSCGIREFSILGYPLIVADSM